MSEIVIGVTGGSVTGGVTGRYRVIGVTAHRKVVARIPEGFHPNALTAKARRYAAHVIACVGVTGANGAALAVSLALVR